MPVNNDYLLLQNWNDTPAEHNVLMTNKPPTSVMVFDAEKRIFVVQLPTLIKRPNIPKYNDLSYPPTFVGEKNEMFLLCFINLGLNDQEAHYFSEDFFSDWEPHVSPKTRGDHVDSTTPLLEILLAQKSAILELSSG